MTVSPWCSVLALFAAQTLHRPQQGCSQVDLQAHGSLLACTVKPQAMHPSI